MLMLYFFAFFVLVQSAPERNLKNSEIIPSKYMQRRLNVDTSDEDGDYSTPDADDSQSETCTDSNWNIKFYIHNATTFFQLQRDKIHNALNRFQKQTCLKFNEVLESEQDDMEGFYIHFDALDSGEGCHTIRNENENFTIALILLNEYYCFGEAGHIDAQLYAALGFKPEHLRPDRDHYVRIMWDNIIPGNEGKFRKEKEGNFETWQLPYDIRSISHFGPYEYSEDEEQTIISKVPKTPLRKNTKLSPLDWYKINSVYCKGEENEVDEE